MTEPDRAAELVEAAAAFDGELAPRRAQWLVAYLDAMLAENRAVNLTAIREPTAALVLHAIDSLAIAGVCQEPAARCLDLGTGNGFPGAAVAALWPQCGTVLCDRTRKKVAAIDRALAEAARDPGGEAPAALTTAVVDAAQAPALQPEWRQLFDLVTVRAVAPPAAAAAIAKPLQARGGQLVLWLEADAATPALAGYGRPQAVLDYELAAPASRARRLAAYRRIPS